MLGAKFCLQRYYPRDEEIVYRYMSFDKFNHLLARGDQFADCYEGIETELGGNFRKAVHNSDAFEENSKLYERNRRCVAISCWSVGDQESMVLWKRFARENCGIAIRTRVEKIRSSLAAWDRYLCVRKVEYVENHDTAFTKFKCPFFPFSIKKQQEFGDENELRIIYGEGKGCVEGSPLYKAQEISSIAVRISIDPSVLICEVVLSPRSTASAFEKVEKICKDTGLNISIVNSSLIYDR